MTHSIMEIANLLSYIMREREEIDLDLYKSDRMRPYDVDRLLCDPTKLESLIGWKPTTGLECGLEKTVAWYREHGWTFRHQGGN